MKLCKDCINYRAMTDVSTDMCNHPQSLYETEPVRGEEFWLTCQVMRTLRCKDGYLFSNEPSDKQL